MLYRPTDPDFRIEHNFSLATSHSCSKRSSSVDTSAMGRWNHDIFRRNGPFGHLEPNGARTNKIRISSIKSQSNRVQTNPALSVLSHCTKSFGAPARLIDAHGIMGHRLISTTIWRMAYLPNRQRSRGICGVINWTASRVIDNPPHDDGVQQLRLRPRDVSNLSRSLIHIKARGAPFI